MMNILSIKDLRKRTRYSFEGGQSRYVPKEEAVVFGFIHQSKEETQRRYGPQARVVEISGKPATPAMRSDHLHTPIQWRP